MNQAELHQKITTELFKGNKLEAIKMTKETLGIGLKEAKDYVEKIERGETPDDIGFPPMKEERYVVSQDKETQEVLRLLQNQQKLEAVKYIRQTRKLGLKESLEYVEQLEAKHGLQEAKSPITIETDTRTRISIVLLAISIIAGFLLWFFWLAD
ncbi:MAG: ribosomal protein L7/L12 [Bacteroidia bacterium]